jgi:hypothetical protein
MSTNDTYLAVFLGSKTSPKMKAWNSLSEAERRAKEREGMAAWKAWVEKHQGAIVAMGGPLGKTKKITQRGIEDITTSWEPSLSSEQSQMRPPPSFSKTIRTLQSSQAKRWR